MTLYLEKIDRCVICGVDEAGRGPVMGPLVIAAVMVESDRPLRKLKVKDSKMLTRKKREELAPKIMEVSQVDMVVISAEEIDHYRGEENLNALEAKHFAALIEKLSPAKAYVDAVDVIEERFGRTVAGCLTCRAEIISEHKADVKYPVVSAASIVAKVTRDRIMDEIAQAIGQPVGTGYSTDPETIEFLERWLRENGDFPPHTRRSWKTAKDLYSLSKVRKLTDWME
jgi:ribonuclease HII